MYEPNIIGRTLSGQRFYTNSEGEEFTSEKEGYAELEKVFIRTKYKILLHILNNSKNCNFEDFYSYCYNSNNNYYDVKYKRNAVISFIKCWIPECQRIGLIESDLKTCMFDIDYRILEIMHQ